MKRDPFEIKNLNNKRVTIAMIMQFLFQLLLLLQKSNKWESDHLSDGDELEFLERVFLLATITTEMDSITIKILRSFFVSIENPYRIIGFLLKTPTFELPPATFAFYIFPTKS